MEPKESVKKSTRKPKMDLATAKVADGALKAPKSLYELVGISENRYKIRDIASYEKSLARLDLIGLQDECYDKGEAANANREVMIDRLTRRFLREHARLPDGAPQPGDDVSEEIREKGLRALSRGR